MNGCTQKRRNGSRAGGRKERKEEEEEESLSAPISTTGILGLIIQMWMLLLENTRSRVDASPTETENCNNNNTEKRKKQITDRQTSIKRRSHRHCVVFN